MKNLLSKEHNCYKIHTLLMKSSAYPLSMDNPPIWANPHFYKKSLIPHSYDFSEILILNKKERVHTILHVIP